MALNDTITALERFSTITVKDQIGNPVMSLRMASFIELLTSQVNQDTPLSGTGSPEGVVVASPFRSYYDSAAEDEYVKFTGVGDTGWILLASGGGGLFNVVEDTTPQLGGNLDTQTFTVDGRDVSVDGTKLDTIETSATADQTNAEIKTAYEANANTNEFDDAEQTKLAGIATGANNYVHPNHSGDVTSTGDGAQVIADEAVTLAKMAHITTASILGRDTAATGDVEVLSVTEVLTLLNVEAGATADQTDA